MTPTADLSELMDALSVALSEGNLAKVGELAPALDMATRDLHLLSPEILHRLRHRAERNAARLLGARRGVLAARLRLAEVLDASRGLSTYDASGRRAIAQGNCEVISRL